MTMIQDDTERLRARNHLRQCLLLILDAIDLKTEQANSETNFAARDNLETEIDELKVELHLIMNRYDSLAELRQGARLTRPSQAAVDRVNNLFAQVNDDTKRAQRAQLILQTVDDVVALAGEVKRLRADAA